MRRPCASGNGAPPGGTPQPTSRCRPWPSPPHAAGLQLPQTVATCRSYGQPSQPVGQLRQRRVIVDHVRTCCSRRLDPSAGSCRRGLVGHEPQRSARQPGRFGRLCVKKDPAHKEPGGLRSQHSTGVSRPHSNPCHQESTVPKGSESSRVSRASTMALRIVTTSLPAT